MWLRVQVQETDDLGTNPGPILFTNYITLDIYVILLKKINYGRKYGILIQINFLNSKKKLIYHILRKIQKHFNDLQYSLKHNPIHEY